jgi:hypothetical protein
MDELPLTWTCHSCGTGRPDREIAVWAHRRTVDGVGFDENVRYCRDRADCRVGARVFHFLPARPEEAREPRP